MNNTTPSHQKNKMTSLFLSILAASILLVVGCKSADLNQDDPSSSCEQIVTISADQYLKAPADPLSVNEAWLDDECLVINFSAGGCDGKSWELALIDSEAILESLPVQRNIRLSLKNEELCDAWITREISFDISLLQLAGYNKVILNLQDSEEPLVYEY